MRLGDIKNVSDLGALIVPTRSYGVGSNNTRFANIQERVSLGTHRVGYAVLSMVGQGDWINHDAIAKNLINRVKQLSDEISTPRNTQLSAEAPEEKLEDQKVRLKEIKAVKELLSDKGGFKGENMKALDKAINNLQKHIDVKEKNPELYEAKEKWCTAIKEIVNKDDKEDNRYTGLSLLLDNILISTDTNKMEINGVTRFIKKNIPEVNSSTLALITDALIGRAKNLELLGALDRWVSAVNQDFTEEDKSKFLTFISSCKNDDNLEEEVFNVFFETVLCEVRSHSPAKLMEGTDQFIDPEEQALYTAANNAFFAIWPKESAGSAYEE